jgi:uncharacterized protein (DUF2267 family)
MATNGLEIFDTTMQTTNAWLDEVMTKLGPDRRVAWKVLSTVLHKLRDRLPVDVAAHLGAQLPLLIRGAYYDQYRPSIQPTAWNKEEFLDEVDRRLSDIRPVDRCKAVTWVFELLSRHLSVGQISKVRQALPKDIRALWSMPVDAL